MEATATVLPTGPPVHYDLIPDELKQLPQWVCWRYEWSAKAKPTKVPYNPRTGKKAASSRPDSWSTYDEAVSVADKYSGIGFVLHESNGIVGGDLDHCIDADGVVAEWAAQIVSSINTYTEITPSGTGLRFICRGVLPEGGRKAGDVEMYQELRYLTITGHHFGSTPLSIEPRQETIEALHAQYLAKESVKPAKPHLSLVTGNGHSLNGMGDAELLAKMFSAKNGATIKRLFEGDYSSHNSQSEADSALCFHFAFYTKDAARIDSLFRQSGLMREKWDTKHGAQTYGQMTINRALEKCTAQYDPHGSSGPRILLRGKAARRHIVGDKAAEPEGDNEPESESDDEDEKAVNNGLYAIQNGRTLLSVNKEKSDEKGSSGASLRGFVWDGAACITGEIADENGVAIYEIEGRTIHGRKIRLDIEAAKIADPKTVASALSNCAGAETVFYASMEKHLGPSIRSFTDRTQLRHGRLFRRVGWTKDGKEFIIPGIEPKDVIMALHNDLPYKVVAPVDGVLAPEAGEALEMLLQSHRAQFTTVAICHALLAPLAQLGGWRDDKFGLFIAGRTGSFKTSVASHVMCLYGDFSNEDKLLKFGMGGTANAMMTYTSFAADVPLLIDNFKPGTGKGQLDAQSLINGVIEGGDKKRLNQDGSLRHSKEIHCWPMFTGEDVIDDAASVARTLIVSAAWEGGETNEPLTAVQGMAEWLPHIGGAWLSWLMTEEARVITAEVKAQFAARRAYWNVQLTKHHPTMVNRSRVASSLALCQCAWEIALACPYLSPILSQYSEAFDQSLKEIAFGMGSYAAQTHEANRYISAVRAMLLSNRAYLVNKARDPDADDKRHFLGWQDDDHIYLLPDNTYREVLEYLRNSNGLNGLGMNTIHRQLNQQKYLVKTDGANLAARKRVGTEGKVQRLLWIKRNEIFGNETDLETEEEDHVD